MSLGKNLNASQEKMSNAEFPMRELISPSQIERTVAELGRRISEDFAAKIDANGKPLMEPHCVDNETNSMKSQE